MAGCYSLLADLILVVHALVVLFTAGALPVIWVGYVRNWKFVRNLVFRVVHLVLIAFIAGQAILGAICPLTTWENLWLSKAGVGPRYPRGYIAYWIRRLLFYDLNERVFIIAYVLFFLLVLLTLIWVKPRKPCQSSPNTITRRG
jgi:polyferredoxin